MTGRIKSDLTKVLFAAGLAVTGLGVQAQETIKVFLMSGQSNMRGLTSTDGLSTQLLAEQQDVLMVRGEENNAGSTLQYLKPNANDTFGPEVSFGRTIADLYPDENFALIKYAKGDTGLFEHWNPQTTGDPYPYATNASGPQYNLFTQTVTNGLTLLENDGYQVEIVGMIWHQGEWDGKSENSTTQQMYEDRLNGFIADMRSMYGENLPFMIGEIKNENASKADIIAAQQAVAANDPFATFVSVDQANDWRSDNHLNTKGMVDLGVNYATLTRRTMGI